MKYVIPHYRTVIVTISFIILISINYNIQSQGLEDKSTSINEQFENSSGIPISLNNSNVYGGPPEISKNLQPGEQITFSSLPTPSALTVEQSQESEESINDTLVGPRVPISNETILGPVITIKTLYNSSNSINNAEKNIESNYKNNSNTTAINKLLADTLSYNVYNNKNTSITKNINNKSVIKPIKVIVNRTVTPTNLPSLASEPSIASNGSIVFYTGNKFAASSFDNGSNWRYIDEANGIIPYCCDQDTIFDPSDNMFIWYKQGITNNVTGENFAALGVSSNLKNWTFYTIKPTDLNQRWTKQWFDFPQLALGKKYLYITTNIQKTDYLFKHAFNHLMHTIILRISLNDLKEGKSPEYSYFQDSTGIHSFVPVQGAKDIMYWGTHLSNNLIRIYQWSESLPWTSIVYYDRSIPAWSKIGQGYGNVNAFCSNTKDRINCIGNGICPTGINNSSNWCQRADSADNMNGWLSGDTIGFIWDAAQGGLSVHNATFKWPYINGALFNITNDMKYIERPYVWSPDFAWLDGYVLPNKNGDLGIIAFYGGGIDNPPSLAVGIHKAVSTNLTSTTKSSKFWQMMPLIKGTNSPNDLKWGDYIRLRNYDNSSNLWVASGYTLQGGDSGKFIDLRYFIFGPTNNENNDIIKDTNNKEVLITDNTSSIENRSFGLSSANNNTLLRSQNDFSNNSCSGITGQYEVVLTDEIMKNSLNAKKVLDDISKKVVSSGVEVTNVFENIGIIVIKSANPTLLGNVLNELKNNPNVASISPTQCVVINS